MKTSTMKPLSIISYPKKKVRNIRISPYTLSLIDSEVFKDLDYSLFRSGFNVLHIDTDLELICSFLSIDVKSSYTNYLIIDRDVCSFK